jgi:cytochrome P450 family 2 subfamily J
MKCNSSKSLNIFFQVVGKSRFPSLSDKDDMPYTSAVLLETLRVGSLAYLAIPHQALEEIKIGQYTIPKGSTVISSLYNAMQDEKYFKNPEIFNPSRFIDENGKFVHDEHVIPFGLGKRYCLGQSLAEKEFFIFFTGLLQQFEVSSAPGTTLPSYIDIFPEEALVRSPPNYQVILKKRI